MARYREHAHTLAWLAARAKPRRRITEFQNRKLRFLADFAYHNVGFYREFFDAAGVRPDQVQCAADLARLPVISKAQLRERRIGEIIC